MKAKKIITGVMMTMAVLGSALSAMADDTIKTGLELQVSEDKVIRDEDGKIVGIDVTDEPVSVYYQDLEYEQFVTSEQFREYERLGLIREDETKTLYFHGMEVDSLEDEYKEGNALQYLSPDWGGDGSHPRISLIAVRDEDYRLQYFKYYKLYDKLFPYDLEEDEYWTEDRMWEEDGIAVDELADPDEELESLTVIGGADEPTEISLEGASGDGNEAGIREEQIRNLYACKTSDTEDAVSLAGMVHSLVELGFMPGADFSVDRKENGSCLIIQFVASLPNTDETIQNLSDCGNILLALVDELSEVRFTYPVEQEEKIQCTLYWDKQAAKEALGRDVKEYGKSLDEFIKLFHF